DQRERHREPRDAPIRDERCEEKRSGAGGSEPGDGAARRSIKRTGGRSAPEDLSSEGGSVAGRTRRDEGGTDPPSPWVWRDQVLPTRSRPGVRVSAPSCYLAGQTWPGLLRPYWAALNLRTSS